MFKRTSGGVKDLIEKILFKIIGVEISAKVQWNKDKKKAKEKAKAAGK